MNCEEIKSKLKTNIFGQNLVCLDQTDSTNTRILQLAKEGAPEGTVVCADSQTAGRGRLGRSWLANPGENLLFSLLLRPERNVDDVQRITLAVATTIVETLRKVLPFTRTNAIIEVKWPNDILINNRKVCGILAESVLQEKKISVLAIGFGLNVNTLVSNMPDEIKELATSLIEFTGKPLDRVELLVNILSRFEKYYAKMELNNYDDVVRSWKKYCRQIGSRIIILSAEQTISAEFFDVNEKGHLMYKTTDGVVKALISGEIRKG